jgi:hypothetical protein
LYVEGCGFTPKPQSGFLCTDVMNPVCCFFFLRKGPLRMLIKNHMFHHMYKLIQFEFSDNNTSQPRWKLLLERSFSVESIDVNILSKQLSCELVLKIHSKFPVDIETEEIQISIDGVSPSKKESLHSRR